MDLSADLFYSNDREVAIDELHAATAIYTREPVVDQLLEHVDWPSGARSLVDTSCGDGAFLRRALARLLAQQPGLDQAAILQRICGWEIHPFAAEQARAGLAGVLESYGYPAPLASQIGSKVVRCGDFLTEGPKTPTFHAVVGNPPYLRLLHVPQPLRSEYEREVPDYARADLLHSFMDRCVRVLHPDGELAFVTSDRVWMNQGAARLREAIGHSFRLAHLERIDVASAFYRPKQRRAGTPPRIHPCAVVLSASRGVPISSQPIYPGAVNTGLRAGQKVLGDIATLRLCPWLGTPGIFLLDAAAAARLPAHVMVPAVDTDDVRSGVLGVPRRCAILTRPEQPPPDAVMAHILRQQHRMSARERRSRTPWLPPEPFHSFDLSQESLLIPRIAKTLAPVRVPAGVLTVNHNISIVGTQGCSLDRIVEALNSSVAADWMAMAAAPLENGYRAITTRLLRQMPVA